MMIFWIGLYAASYIFGAWLMYKVWMRDFNEITVGDLIFFSIMGFVTPSVIIASLVMWFSDKPIFSKTVIRRK